ncbi:hypothetical protein AVEN_132135-1 [Araneus ventricosus]|uniref:Uncharacterized protein n=1 Tax=Araneus ventricosus TaxID=182803 RepID=A0A4Y2L2X8_ARAVE|nr:hypothetical protein AVEN_132135-1 [Araneus ventricosus]
MSPIRGNVALLWSRKLRAGQMNKKEEISMQDSFNRPIEFPQRVTEMKSQCTIVPDLFQRDHPYCGPRIASCSQRSGRANISSDETNISPEILI